MQESDHFLHNALWLPLLSFALGEIFVIVLCTIINPRIIDIVITTPTAISIPNARDPKKGLSSSSGVKAGV